MSSKLVNTEPLQRGPTSRGRLSRPIFSQNYVYRKLRFVGGPDTVGANAQLVFLSYVKASLH